MDEFRLFNSGRGVVTDQLVCPDCTKRQADRLKELGGELLRKRTKVQQQESQREELAEELSQARTEIRQLADEAEVKKINAKAAREEKRIRLLHELEEEKSRRERDKRARIREEHEAIKERRYIAIEDTRAKVALENARKDAAVATARSFVSVVASLNSLNLTSDQTSGILFAYLHPRSGMPLEPPASDEYTSSPNFCGRPEQVQFY